MVMNYDGSGNNLLDLIEFENQKEITPKEAFDHFNVPKEYFKHWLKSVIPKNESYFEFYVVDYN